MTAANVAIRRGLLLAILILVMAEWAHFMVLAHAELPPNQLAEHPFDFSLIPPEVVVVRPPARDAGIRRGDRILSINGISVAGNITLHRAVAAAKPGERLSVEVASSDGRRTVAIPLRQRSYEGDARLTLVFQYFTVVLCTGLGFLVAFLRPLDARAWILLFLLSSFPHMFRFIPVPLIDGFRFLYYPLSTTSDLFQF
jgi:membrane-associated protease RseP (regulator of RpoE activity)